MSSGQNGKNDKNRLRGDSLKAYGESKLWQNLKKKKDSQPFDYFTCNDCGFRIDGNSMQQMKFNFGCPRCKNSFEDFTGTLNKKKAVKK